MSEELLTTAFYAALTTIALLLAWRGRSRPMLLAAAWMALAFLVDTIVFYRLGIDEETGWAPPINAAATVLVMGVAIQFSSRICWSIVWLFIVSCVFAISGIWANVNGTWLYHAVLNALFVARLLTVGTAACVLANRDGVSTAFPGRHAVG